MKKSYDFFEERKTSMSFDSNEDFSLNLGLLEGDEKSFKNHLQKREAFANHQALKRKFLEKKLNDEKVSQVKKALGCGLTLSAVKYIFNLTEEQASSIVL